MDMQHWVTHFALPALAGLVASCTGLAVLLNSSRAVTPRTCLGALLLHGLAGFGLACVLVSWHGSERPQFAMGVSVLVGLSGLSALDLLRMGILRSARLLQNGDSNGGRTK